jgi:hypothetical protein
MREIRPRSAWTVAKMPDKIPGVRGTLLSNELQRFMLVVLHFGTADEPQRAQDECYPSMDSTRDSARCDASLQTAINRAISPGSTKTLRPMRTVRIRPRRTYSLTVQGDIDSRAATSGMSRKLFA